jgi:hypothetical protein
VTNQEVLSKARDKAAELSKMLGEDENDAERAFLKAPVWAHWLRRRIELAREMTVLLGQLKLGESGA